MTDSELYADAVVEYQHCCDVLRWLSPDDTARPDYERRQRLAARVMRDYDPTLLTEEHLKPLGRWNPKLRDATIDIGEDKLTVSLNDECYLLRPNGYGTWLPRIYTLGQLHRLLRVLKGEQP